MKIFIVSPPILGKGDLMVLSFAANLLNRLKWTKKLPESVVVILHRGAPGDVKRIDGDHITEIKKDHFYYIEPETGDETYIPMHRVLEIWMDEGLVWRKRSKQTASQANSKNSKAKIRRRRPMPTKRRGRKSAPHR